jgi:hypothetical protein
MSGLIGDARRRAKLEFLQVKHRRDQLDLERTAVRAAIARAMSERRGIDRQLTVQALRTRHENLIKEWATAASRAASLAEQLGRSA